MRIVQYYIWRKPLDNPFMLKPVVRSQPFVWIPLKASADEVYEGWVRELS